MIGGSIPGVWRPPHTVASGGALADQTADDLAREHGAERVALTVAPPAPTGDLRLDAFIAGLTEHRLNQEHLPLPRWIADAARLDAPWTPAGVTPDHAVPELAARGVLVDHTDLTSA